MLSKHARMHAHMPPANLADQMLTQYQGQLAVGWAQASNQLCWLGQLYTSEYIMFLSCLVRGYICQTASSTMLLCISERYTDQCYMGVHSCTATIHVKLWPLR